MKMFAAILSAEKYGLTDGNFNEDMKEVYRLRSAMTWNPPETDTIDFFKCFSNILQGEHQHRG